MWTYLYSTIEQKLREISRDRGFERKERKLDIMSGLFRSVTARLGDARINPSDLSTSFGDYFDWLESHIEMLAWRIASEGTEAVEVASNRSKTFSLIDFARLGALLTYDYGVWRAFWQLVAKCRAPNWIPIQIVTCP